jgi:hypothetical protein
VEALIWVVTADFMGGRCSGTTPRRKGSLLTKMQQV